MGTNASGYPTNEYQSYQYPTWAEDLGYRQGNMTAGMMDRIGGMTNNWYQGPLVAGLGGLQQQAMSQAGNPYQWQDAYGAAGNALMAAARPYNTDELQQYLDPYASGVVSNMGRLSKEKLLSDMEDINSTFTGAGTFGGTRNQKFIQDALQRSQREFQGAAGNVMSGAYNNANANYLNWANRPLQVASGLQALGSGGAGLAWNDINNQFGLGAKEQATRQSAMDAAYKDWMNQYQMPASLMTQLGQLGNQTIGAFRPNISGSSQTQVPQINGWQQAGGALGLLQQLLGALE